MFRYKIVKNLLTQQGAEVLLAVFSTLIFNPPLVPPMKKIILSSLAVAALAAGSGQSQVVESFSGNGNTGFGGTVGNGILQISSDITGSLDFTFTRGTDTFNNALVIYFDTVSGGAASTSGFTDSADGLRVAISGFNGTDRSTLNFASGFEADYAIALDSSFAGLWSLSNGADFGFVSEAGLAPVGNQSATSYTFSISGSDIGLTAGSGQSFSFFTSYISSTAFRSTETFGASFSGSPTQGYTTFDAAGSNSFTTIPEPSTYALLALSALGLAGYAARRRARR